MAFRFELYCSQLGEFELKLESTHELPWAESGTTDVCSLGHAIRLQRLQPPSEWLPNRMHVETATAWVFYIIKCNSTPETLSFGMEMLPGPNTVAGETETGQYLIAVGFENDIRQLHLGTEDEDAMAERASRNDWMPMRLIPLLNSGEFQVTTVTASGLRTTIPPLETGEQFCFHYIIAENPRRESVEHPNEPDLSTWCAVYQTRKQLEQDWQPSTTTP